MRASKPLGRCTFTHSLERRTHGRYTEDHKKVCRKVEGDREGTGLQEGRAGRDLHGNWAQHDRGLPGSPDISLAELGAPKSPIPQPEGPGWRAAIFRGEGRGVGLHFGPG